MNMQEPSIRDIKGRIWPAFQRLYEDGGDNVAELDIAACACGHAASIVGAITEAGGNIRGVSDLNASITVVELAPALERLCVDSNGIVEAVVKWHDRQYQLLAHASSSIASTFDIEIMYKSAIPLLDKGRSDDDNLQEFLHFINLGVRVCAAGRARGLSIVYDEIFTISDPVRWTGGLVVIPPPRN